MAPKLSVSIDSLMTYLGWVGDNTRMKKCVRNKYTFSHLTRELRLLKRICCCAEKFLLQDLPSESEENEEDQTLESFFNHLGDAINKKLWEIYPVCLEISEGLELDNKRSNGLFSGFIDAVVTLKPLCGKTIDKYMDSSQSKHCTMDELLDFIRLVSEEGKEIHSESSLKNLELPKLDFLKYFISFAASRGVEQDKLRDLLAHTRVLAITAAFCSYMLWEPEVMDGKTRSLIYSHYSQKLKFLPVTVMNNLSDPTQKLSVLIETLRSYLARLEDFLRNTDKCNEFRFIKTDLRLLQRICSCLEMFFLQDLTSESDVLSLEFYHHCLGLDIDGKARKIYSVIQEMSKDLDLQKHVSVCSSSFRHVVEILKRFLFGRAIDKYMDSSQSRHCTMDELQDFIRLVSEEGKEIHNGSRLDYLQLRKLEFLKSFIIFAASRVEQDKLEDLLAYAEVAVTTASYCSYMLWTNEVTDETSSSIYSRYFSMLKVELKVRESFIRVLKALGSSCSSDSTKMDYNIVDTFIDSLLENHWQLLASKSSFTVSFMKILIEELRFLRNFLIYRSQEGGNLDEEMTNLVYEVVSEAGIVSYSISWDDEKEVPTRDTKLALSNWMDKVQLLKENVVKKYQETSKYKFPRTNELGFIDGLLEDLKELIRYKPDSIAFAQGQLDVVLKDLVFLRDFLRDMVKRRNEHEELKALRLRVVDVAYRFEFVISSLVVGDPSPDCSPTAFNTIKEEIKKISAEVEDICKGKRFQISTLNTAKTSNHLTSRSSDPTEDEVVVGFQDEAKMIIDQLQANSAELDIVSIVGMPGQGKTTLAMKVYKEIRSHFHVSGWCCVSQGYQKRELLLKLLRDSLHELPIGVDEMSDEDLEKELYKSLKGRRYLIVLDDIWDIKAWRGLQSCFPNDGKRSRILITSRINIRELQVKPHFLRLLNDNESRELLQKKLVHNKGCYAKLGNLGMQIAKICKGLPLAIVIVAGILATLEQDRWEKFAEGLTTSLVTGTEECKELFELSYEHLPDHLKPCLLYFGAFLQDEEISVSRLIWLWMAEGFVKKTTGEKSLEKVAEDYLKDLINRSLVMVVKQTSRGGIKACIVHDLVHQFCVTTAKEENFLHLLNLKEKTGPLSEPRRLCIYSWEGVQCFRRLRSLKFFPHSHYIVVSEILCRFKILKVLDLRGMSRGCFPKEVEMLVHLRFLALAGNFDSVPPAIVKLWNLETFLLIGLSGGISLPHTLMSMTRLRHMHVNRPVLLSLPQQKLCKQDISNLETFSTALLSSGHDMVNAISKIPYLRKLKCTYSGSWFVDYQFPALNFLRHLESLTVHSADKVLYPIKFSFPNNLKKLTLSNFALPWASISSFAKLHNLEVLKLLNRACEGETWEMEEKDVFRKLQFLKFENLDIVHWNACCDNFPLLRQLVLYKCWTLQGIPSDLGEVNSLKIVEVKHCHGCVATSAQILMEEVEGLKAFIQ